MVKISFAQVIFMTMEFVCAEFNLTVLHTNDVHSRVEELNTNGGRCSDNDKLAGRCYGGVARRHTMIKEVREGSTNTILLDGGDQFQGTTWFGVYKGLEAVTFMNLDRYDAMALGNHEFDNGVEDLIPFILNATFSILSANMNVSKVTNWPENSLFEKSKVFQRSGVKIGVIGYITPETSWLSRPGPNISFHDIISSVQAEAIRLKGEGVHIIIALGHAGFETDKRVAAEVNDLDLVVGGHTNTFLYTGKPPSIESVEGPYPYVITRSDGSKCLVVQAFTFGKYLGKLDINFDKEGKATYWSGNPILLNSSIPEDPLVKDMIASLSSPILKGRTVSCFSPFQCFYVMGFFYFFVAIPFLGKYWNNISFFKWCNILQFSHCVLRKMLETTETAFNSLKNKSQLLVQFVNCRMLFNNAIVKEDFWVRDGVILNPEKVFFDEKISADIQIDCNNMIIAPGYIDTQLNGGFGYDFSSNIDSLEDGLNIVSKGILKHGVTSFCPTLVTSPANIYRQALPILMKRKGGRNGAEILGAHCEGPFINIEKRGAHDPNYIKSNAIGGIQVLESTYGSLDNIAIITVAPELPGIIDCIPLLVNQNIVVSIGHSTATLCQSESAVSQGASFITHLFNAMLPFHHRDPGMVGVLTSNVTEKTVFYGMITDGIHTHPTALRIAHRSHPKGIVLITDAIAALALSPGTYKLGTMSVEISEKDAKIAGTNTLAGSVCSMDRCVYHFKNQTECSLVDAIEAATLHPAQLLGISNRKGTLDFGTDADFIFLDDELNVHATFIAGDLVWNSEKMSYLSKIYN